MITESIKISPKVVIIFEVCAINNVVEDGCKNFDGILVMQA